MAVLFENLIEVRDSPPHPAPLNMAIDETLLIGARDVTLRTYRWARPAVSFGYFGKFAEVESAWPGREIVRRMTGGGVVPHGGDLTYSLIVPSENPFASGSPREIYRTVHEAIAALLVQSGVVPELAPAGDHGGSGVCFESPAEFDLLAGRRKIGGAALRRTRAGLLLQGSIQQLPDCEALRPRLAAAFGTRVIGRELSPSEMAEADSLALGKYATREWTCRV